MRQAGAETECLPTKSKLFTCPRTKATPILHCSGQELKLRIWAQKEKRKIQRIIVKKWPYAWQVSSLIFLTASQKSKTNLLSSLVCKKDQGYSGKSSWKAMGWSTHYGKWTCSSSPRTLSKALRKNWANFAENQGRLTNTSKREGTTPGARPKKYRRKSKIPWPTCQVLNPSRSLTSTSKQTLTS